MIRNEQLADIDELVLRCRDMQAQAYISEAVACYKVGAFRASIVAAWIAVVFDILAKLEELELTGDKNAIQKLADFEKHQQNQNIDKLLDFERDVLVIAKDDFELLTAAEFDDLVRLRDDRNRCAHPSMNAAREIYSPSAELARYHLRNAVVHLLQHPPVQGKAALDRLLAQVSSEYFPLKLEDAVAAFSSGPLANPRDSLVRSFVITLMKSALLQPVLGPGALQRFLSATKAVRTLHYQLATQAIAEKLNKIALRVEDVDLIRVIVYLHEVTDTWQHLEASMRTRLEQYVRSMPQDDLMLVFPRLIEIPELNQALTERLSKASAEETSALVRSYPCHDLVRHAIDRYAGSAKYDAAVDRRKKLVIPLIPYFDSKDVANLVGVIASNFFLSGDYGVGTIFNAILWADVVSKEELDALTAIDNLQDTVKNYEGYTAVGKKNILNSESDVPVE